MRILVVDDDRDIRAYLKANLEAECFAVDTAGDGEQGSRLGQKGNYDAIVLDNNMPLRSGISVCSDIRDAGKNTPILMLSIDGDSEKKADLLDKGADDYLSKPFLYRELRARIRALLRRPPITLPSIIHIGDLVLDNNLQTVKRNNKRIHFTRKEFALLHYLMRNADHTVSKTTLLEHVWDSELDIFSNTLEAHIRNIRRKIDCQVKKKLLHTVPGLGYQISQTKPI